MRYEEINHTADVGIRAYGATAEELFMNAAAGMFSLVVDLETVKPVGEVELRVAADDLAGLLVNWLSDLLFLHETQRLLFSDFDVRIEGRSLGGHARGEVIDKTRHELRLALKAVTYHHLTLDLDRGVAEVVFDI